MTRRLLVFRSLWSNGFNLEAALSDCRAGNFDGIEGPVPRSEDERREFARRLNEAGAPLIAEIATGGGYVPANVFPDAHLEEFRRMAEAARECAPLFLTVMAGCDAWPLAQSVDFLGRALEIAGELGLVASFETHRSRPTFNPWATRDLLRQLPDLKLTCDFSHWCCVCERLVLDQEPSILALCAERAHHIHARVGYEQGPQVPHPPPPPNGPAREAPERWGAVLWQAGAGRAFSTLTPEFGPDGYLQARPFSKFPAADLDEVNRWMAARQRDRFNVRQALASLA